MKNSEILVSIVMPVYNVEPYLRDAVDSLRGQTHEKLDKF